MSRVIYSSHLTTLFPKHKLYAVARHRNILILKANEMHYFSNLFHKVLYMFRTGPLSIIRSISTLFTRNSSVGVC